MDRQRKLIEVALPLEVINTASASEKANPFTKSHPRGLHQWWARRPLAACRAVLFASLVNDPSSEPDRFPTLKAQEVERSRLFGILERLVQWENTTNEEVLESARVEIRRATGGSPPALVDPFAGGGAIPLEAQRLGLRAHASDLNPVAVLITKGLIEIPPKFAGIPPVHPEARNGVGATGSWRGSAGLAEDIRRYGLWMRTRATQLIGDLYPPATLPMERGGGSAPVFAWIWARSVQCPNPACRALAPLMRSFVLSSRKGSEARVEPKVDRNTRAVTFSITTGPGKAAGGTVGRQGARCLVCESSIPFDYVRSEGRAKRMQSQLVAMVAQGTKGRVFLPPTQQHSEIALAARAPWLPMSDLPDQALGFRVQAYGITKHSELFTARQLAALATLSDLVAEARRQVVEEAVAAGWSKDPTRLQDGGSGAVAYGDAIATYLAFAVDQLARYSCSLTPWNSTNQNVAQVFGRQTMSMVWDFAEANPIQGPLAFSIASEWVADALGGAAATGPQGWAAQADAASAELPQGLVSTDPPYYDNVPYADLSDFFYVWLRHSLADIHPGLFGTLLTPKAAELVADAARYGGRAAARSHFEDGLRGAFERIRIAASEDFPVSVYYAFKQAEDDTDVDGKESVASTGWETMLEGLLGAGLAITGTWPIRTERATRLRDQASNALASSIVLVCRPRSHDAGITDRRGFLSDLKATLPGAVRTMQHGNIAPVDLAQSAIGPGMGVFSGFQKVVEPDGVAMSVRTALGIINQVLGEILSEQEDEFDRDTRWAITWFEQYHHDEADFDRAAVLARAKGVGMNGLVESGIVRSRAGRTRLLRRSELDGAWDPATDERVTVWEATLHLVRALDEGGETTAAALVRRLGGLADTARDLAYRLYAICDRKKWTEDALGYNALVAAWPEITRLAASTPGHETPQQTQLFS